MRTQHLNCNLIELKLAPSEPGLMEFSGYAAVFGNIDSYGDVIAEGAFSKYLEKVHNGTEQWPLFLAQHGGMGLSVQDMTPIGVWKNISEDEKGLKVTGKLADTERGRENYELIKMQPRPAFSGLSIGYFAVETINGKKTDPYARLLKQIDLVEISLVSHPANNLARIGHIKSAYDMNDREFEQFLRDSGELSRKDAQTVISKGFRALKTGVDSRSEELKQLAALCEKYASIFKSH